MTTKKRVSVLVIAQSNRIEKPTCSGEKAIHHGEDNRGGGCLEGHHHEYEDGAPNRRSDDHVEHTQRIGKKARDYATYEARSVQDHDLRVNPAQMRVDSASKRLAHLQHIRQSVGPIRAL